MKISILATSDTHGYVRAYDELTHAQTTSGLSRVASFVKQRRKEEKSIVLIDNGDTLEGSLFATYLYASQDDWEEHPLVTAMNSMQYDAAIPGNHEFNYGMPFLTRCTQQMAFPYLAANVINRQTNEPYWDAYTIIERDAVKIGVIGLITDYVPRMEPAENISNVKFVDPFETAKDYVEKLRSEVDILLLSYHGGTERDLETGLPTEYQTGENIAYRLAAEIKGIDGVIAGHQHKVLTGFVGSVPVVQPGTKGSHVGEMTFTLEKTSGRWKIQNCEAQLVDMKDYKEDEELIANLHHWTEAADAWMEKPITENLSITDVLHTIQQTLSGEAISGISLFTKTDNTKEVTMKQIMQNFTFPCTFAVLRLTGLELKQGLETATRLYISNKCGAITPFPIGQNGEASMWRGLDYKVENGKVVYVNTNAGQLIEDDTVLTIVCNHYKQVQNERIFPKHSIINEVMIYIPDMIAMLTRNNQMTIPVQTHQYKTLHSSHIEETTGW